MHHVHTFLKCTYIVAELLGQKVCVSSFQIVVPVDTLTNSIECSVCAVASHSCPHLELSDFNIFASLLIISGISLWLQSAVSLITSEVKRFLICLIDYLDFFPLDFFLCEISVQVFDLFFHLIVFFLSGL